MGLDMFLYKFKEIDPAIARSFEGEFESFIEDLGYHVWERLYEDFREIEEIRDFLVKTKVYRTVWDFERFKRKYDLKGWSLISTINEDDKTVLVFSRGDEQKEFRLSRTEHNSYYKYQLCECYIASYEEVDYWRKEYDLQDLIHMKHSNGISNCQYVGLTDEEVEAIEKYCGKSYPALNDDEVYVYMEWY